MKKTILAFLSLSFLLVSPLATKAIGQITEPIIIKDGMRGQEISQTLTLLNSEKKQNIIGIVADGQIADWASFYNKDDKEFKTPIKEIEVPAGVYLDVAVLFKVPADAANGDYTGEISVVYNPNQSASTTESSSVVAQRISREVKITISDQEKIDLKASVIPDKFDYNPGEPIKLRIIYDNQSNISLKPSVQIKIKKDEQSVYNVIHPYPETEPAVRSMSLYEIPAITINTDTFGEGKFLAELNFLKGDQTILTSNFSFSIGTQEAVKGISFAYIKDNLLAFGGGLAGLIVLLAVVFIIARKTAGNKVATPAPSNGKNKK